jgi:hypothetical protein
MTPVAADLAAISCSTAQRHLLIQQANPAADALLLQQLLEQLLLLLLLSLALLVLLLVLRMALLPTSVLLLPLSRSEQLPQRPSPTQVPLLLQ